MCADLLLIGLVAKALSGAVDRATNLGGPRPLRLTAFVERSWRWGTGVPLKVSGLQLNGENVIDIFQPDNKDGKIVAHDAAQHVQVRCADGQTYTRATHTARTFASGGSQEQHGAARGWRTDLPRAADEGAASGRR